MKLNRFSKKLGILYVILYTLVFLSTMINKHASADEIYIRLSGDHEYPGFMSLITDSFGIKKLCFLGAGAKGNLDTKFLTNLSRKGIPEGKYALARPLPEDQWPSSKFIKNGALRFKPVVSSALTKIANLGKQGLAVHGRDFYPLIQNHIAKKQMISYYNETLFARLQTHWGTLRISNWDMGRLYDFWKAHGEPEPSWSITVQEIDSQEAQKRCKPPVIKRKADE